MMQTAYQQNYKWLMAVLDSSPHTYADTFRFEVLCEIENLGPEHPDLKRVLRNFSTKEEIETWIEKLLSRLVMTEGKTKPDVIIHEWLEGVDG